MAQQVQKVDIPGIRKERITITIVGETSLISHKFSDKNKQAMLDKQMKRASAMMAKKTRDPQADYEGSIYYTDDGQPGFPASGIKKACVHACRFLDMAMTEARGAFLVMGEILPIDGTPQMREDIVRLPRDKADLRYRADYPEWSITFDVLYNPRIISVESIINLVETAGFHIGIGDWRPEKNGTHGMFRVKRED